MLSDLKAILTMVFFKLLINTFLTVKEAYKFANFQAALSVVYAHEHHMNNVYIFSVLPAPRSPG